MRYEESVAASADIVIHTPEILHDFMARNFSKRLLSSSGAKYRPSRALRFALHLMTHIHQGQLDVILPDETALRFVGKIDGPQAILRLHDDRMAKRFLTKGQLGFCEAYLDGDWSSPDMATFFKLILLNAAAMRKTLLGKKWARMLSNIAHLLKRNSKAGSRKNIYQHYDIGNDFYAAWLDPSMTYSSALFSDGITNLDAAQDRKYAEMVSRLDLKPEHHVLEIGCGWGGFAEYAAREIGCKITAITVSEAQYDYAVARIANAGLADLVDIRLQDYRDVDGTYDRIASIEMFEAVGEAYWPVFFNTLKARLKSGGHAVMQIITIRDRDFETYRKSADYIQRYIFPGGMLPSMQALGVQIAGAGLRQGGHLCFGTDYARTLELWNAAFQKAWPALNSDTLDTRFKRLWEQYLCYCQAGFETGAIDVVQIAVHKD